MKNKAAKPWQTSQPIISQNSHLPIASVSTINSEEVITPSGDGERKSMTPDQLRKYPGLEHLSDEQALEDIETLDKLAAILLEFYALQKSIGIDNQQIVYLKQQKQVA